MTEEDKRSHAWIGDAVLALFARKWILARSEIAPKERANIFRDLTSNQFLTAFGEPTAVEARIGQHYEKEGIDSAFKMIEREFLPAFEKRNLRRKLPGSYRNRK